MRKDGKMLSFIVCRENSLREVRGFDPRGEVVQWLALSAAVTTSSVRIPLLPESPLGILSS